MSRAGGLALVALVGLVVTAGPAWAAEDGPRAVFRFDDQITESSGLVDLGDRVLTINDSGDDAVVYVVDPTTGATVGRTTYADEVSDVEAITQGPDGDIWVGDIGDNGADRSGVRVHRIERPTDGDRRVEATSYDLAYADGARDAETLLVSPTGRLYIVSKGLFSGQVWQAPEQLRTDRANPLREVGDVGGLITDGAWFPDGRHVVLRDYGVAYVYDVAERPWRLVDRRNIPDLQQGEGIAVRPNGNLLISSEGTRQPVVEVPVGDELAPPRDTAAPQPSADIPAGTQEVPPDPGFDAFVRGRDIRVTLAIAVVAILLVVLTNRLLRRPGGR